MTDPTPEPTDPQPVPETERVQWWDALRDGRFMETDGEIDGIVGMRWADRSERGGRGPVLILATGREVRVPESNAVEVLIRDTAASLTPREGDLVEAHGYEGQVVHVAHGLAVVDMTDDTESKHEFHYADHGVAGGWPHPASACDPTPEPTDPQPVPDTYRCGDLNDDEWEVQSPHGYWSAPSTYHPRAIRLARRKQAPPLTPREGDLVLLSTGHSAVVESDTPDGCGRICILVDGVNGAYYSAALPGNLTVTDRPPKRPVRVWLTDDELRAAASCGSVHTGMPFFTACRALVDEG